MISRNGICYDLTKSEYRLKVGNLIYVFSSQLHLNKFQKRLRENRSIINYSLSKRFGYTVDLSTLADIVLYRKIETRGFLIENEEGLQLWQKEKVIFGGGNLMKSPFENV